LKKVKFIENDMLLTTENVLKFLIIQDLNFLTVWKIIQYGNIMFNNHIVNKDVNLL
jgi:hypothetical protein